MSTWPERPVADSITATDDEIRKAVSEAEVPPLLPALAYLTGDLSLLSDDLRPDPLLLAMEQGGLTEEQLATARELAVDTLIKYRDAGSEPAPVPSDDVLLRIMEYAVGGTEMAAYLPLLEEELAYRGEDRRAPAWLADSDVDLHVLIIGAGMSGLLAAHRLHQAGVSFVIVEKDREVGGTWWENSYPGCRVDNPNHNYSYSFAQRHDWPFHFSTQDVLLDYFRNCADTFELREHIHFNTEVESATWDDATETWTVDVRGPAGPETMRANAIISAVGQLNRPKLPEIAGRDLFEGPSFHSARWNHDVDLRGKRVGVIGTGASAMQFIPEIATEVGELTVFQRTPAWMGPTPDYHAPVSDGLKWLYAHVPSYSEWNRFWIFWRMGDGGLPNFRVDPEWPANGESVSAVNDFVRLVLVEYLKAEFGDRPDLLDKVTPHYPPGAKRMIRDNGIWARTLKRDNVQPRHRRHPRDHAEGRRDCRWRGASVRRAHLRHRVLGVEVPHADEGHRPRRHRPPRAVERRRARVPGRDRPGLSQPLLSLRAEHEHRRERVDRLLLRVRRAVHPRLPEAAA